MFARKFVTALALASAVALGTTGCSLTNNIPTLQSYAPSDGAQIEVAGVKALNVIYLTKRVDATAAEVGALIGSFVNTSTEPVTVHVQFDVDGSEASDVVLPQIFDWESEVIPAGGKLDLGYNEVPALSAIALKDGRVARPGDVINVKISVGKARQNLNVPVLDGSLEQYAALVQNLGASDEHSAE